MDVDVNVAAFAQASQGLVHNGAVPILHYLNDLALFHPVASTSGGAPPPQSGTTQDIEPTIPKAVARIHQACQQAFGSTQPLKFDFEEDVLTHGKRCTLTITRPDGAIRTYASNTLYGRKYDAKASVCTLAISDGALDFIFDESSTQPSSSAVAFQHSNIPLDMDDFVKEIEQCCLEWASGRVKPFWLNISEPKFGKTHGCALRIRLGPRNSRVYSVNTVYSSIPEARKACAEAALADGVINFIRSWVPSDDMDIVEESDPFSAIGLQQFFDSLPKPFPETVAGRSATDINGPAWLNTTIQSARGGKLVPNFIWTSDARHNLHGCLLRLERPGEVRSYLVEARFVKRMEAKAAVCLLAMSEGVGDYIRDVGKAVKDRLSPATRKHVSEVLQPLFNAEYRKVRGPGIQPAIEFDQDMDACGATMVIELAPNPGPQEVRRYTVPTEYCNRNDARLAVIHRAVQEGVIDFLRLQGNTQPSGSVPYAPQQEPSFVNRKRKNWDNGNSSGYSNDDGPRSGDDWSNHNDFGPSSAGGHFRGGWQNKKQRTGDTFRGGSGLDSTHSFRSPQTQSYGNSGPRGGFSQRGGFRPAWHSEQSDYVQPRKQGWNWNQPAVFRPPPPRGGFGGQFKASPRGGFAGPSGFVPRQQPAPVPIPPPAVQYPTIPMPSQQQSRPLPPSYPYPGGGAVPGNAQSAQAASSGAVPHAQHIPIPYQTPAPQPPVAPFGVPSAGVSYSPYVAPPAALPQSLQYPPQQYPYVAGPPSLPANGQVAGYQQYSPPAQPQVPIQPVTAPAPPGPAPPAMGFPMFPYPNFPPATPANPTYAPSFAQPQPQPPRPLPQQLPQPPPLPLPPTVQPPPPPPPSVPPLPAPTSPPILASSTATPKPPQSQPTPPARPASTSDPLSSWPSKPKNPAKVVSIPTTPKTNVQALYDYCNQHGMPTPQWGQELTNGDVRKHKVWVVIGKMKFEIPVPFSSLSQAQERVAGKVVDQFKAQGPVEALKTVVSKG
ncbi:hypothetical protein GSI_05272 [Ganoderma sinense ZZ0214-1]|uniref:Uncharacterized protein n=1 Tax=Ganoderma sinense ZZ0214-1 TaxID=1077348 RepID=A0A2G8SFM1_9APHY|nr:hypothetical protein GSI_05272 [Ganoderma sinense ZZ0214-1]